MKKLFALLLVLVMVIAIVPAAAAEAEGTPSAAAGQETPGDSKGCLLYTSPSPRDRV